MINVNFKCSYNGKTLQECEKEYKFNSFAELAEQWKNASGDTWTVTIEPAKITAVNKAGKIYEYTLIVKKHFFSVLWETKTTTGSRRQYTRDFENDETAKKFAREKRNNPKTAHVELSEQETKDTPECLHVKILQMYMQF